MRFSSTLLLSLLPAAFALPSLAPRQDSGDRAPELLQTVKDLNAAVPELTKAVNAFEGEWLSLLPQALGVVAAETKVDLTIVKATKITEDSTPFTPAETTEIVQTLASGIGPIQDSLTAIKTKYPNFKQTFLSPIVLLDLKILKKHTGELITALQAKSTGDSAGLLGFGANILNGAFDDAIKVYSQ